MAKMTMKDWEDSSMDDAMDSKTNSGKEGSKKEQSADRKALKEYNSKQSKGKSTSDAKFFEHKIVDNCKGMK